MRRVLKAQVNSVMEYQRGQILLIVVLIMVTALTVGLAVAARTISNVRTSEESKNSEQAFSAAEAGIEQTLTNGSAVTGSFSNQSSYTTTLQTISGVQFPLNGGSPIFKDDSVDLWLSTYPTYASPWTGTLTLYWGQATDTCTNNEATNTKAALEIVLIKGTAANPSVTRYALDSCAARALNNKFTVPAAGGGTINGVTYTNRQTIAVTSGLLMRIIPLYAPAYMSVKACDSAGNNCGVLPAQGTMIVATGTAASTTRKLVSSKQYPKLPTELFPYSFFMPQ